ncbi:CYFA0S01e16864g1_1 [Cyberlindnera fabianii]|uniref:alkaline phosphatase n=1 Tax=Cyberlindnera fabianii TaxID=36022 RepID=A0A061AQW8_CYBFA|nr:Repressible alkaline phosphatase [Cyberlindnera fabianii]CDR37773.1 CYFA0S01e16864g1_1 [Cyberlindnera fabianii]
MQLPHAVLLCLFTALVAAVPHKYDEKKNIIFMVADGLGLSGITAAREYLQVKNNLTYEEATLEMENYLIGTVRTQSSSNYITDSAAAGSAFAMGEKTYNGAISVDPNGVPKGTFYEGAKLLNYTTGIVSTTFVQDATICTPNTHVLSRKSYDLVATQQLGFTHPLGQTMDIVIGGGRQYLHGANSTQYPTKGARKDGVDYISKAQEEGWTYMENMDDLYDVWNSTEPQLPLLGLFAAHNIPYEVDRNASEYPSLTEMSLVALEQAILATENTEKGFVLLLEGARIDHAGHANDPKAHALETIAHSDAFMAVLDRVSSLDTETLVVSTSDHETGGLGVGYNGIYEWWPENYINNMTHSAEWVQKKFGEYEGDNKTEVLKEILVDQCNFSNFTDSDIESLVESEDFLVDLAHVFSAAVNLGWTSTAHTQQDVGIYAWSNTEEGYQRLQAAFGSSIENTEIPHFFAQELGVDLDEITELIKDIDVE